MSDTVIKVENLSKLYRLGEIGTGTLSHDINRWIAKVRGKEDPFAKIGQVNDRTQKAIKDEYIWALKDISFEVKQGEVLGIIGKNGAGKSTLLKILSRITSPTIGNIKLKGRVASLLEVGTGFHPEMTGRENVYLNGTILGMTKWEIDRKFEEIMDFAGCLKYADTPVKRFSSGMMVRLGFAVAAFLEPEILIVDEVLAVGDAEFQKKAIGKIQDISRGNGRTVLFVSHNMASIQNLCKSVLLLSNGTVEKVGNTESIVTYYLNNFLKEISAQKLESRSDRKGDGKLKFLDVFFEDNKGNHLKSLHSGLDCFLNISLKNNTNEILSNVQVAVGIDDSQARRLTVLSNNLTNQSISVMPKENKTVRIAINSLPLQHDTYYFTLFCSVNGDISDWIQNATSFYVDEGDYFHTGKTIQGGQGNFLINHEFIS